MNIGDKHNILDSKTQKLLNNPILEQINQIKKTVAYINSPAIEIAQSIKITIPDIHKSFSETQKVFKNIYEISKQFSTIEKSVLEFQKSYNFIGKELITAIQKTSLINDLQNLKSYEYDFEEIYIEKQISKEVIIDDSRQLRKIITDIYADNNFIYSLTGRKFEEVVAELLFKKGFEVELTKQTRDNGYDIIALQNVSGFKTKFLVECKKYSSIRPVGIEIIRSFADVLNEENANKGIIVTTSYFTKEVKKRQLKMGHMLDLADKNQLLEWVVDYLITN